MCHRHESRGLRDGKQEHVDMTNLPMEQTQKQHLVPDVNWISCGFALPEAGKFVWVCVGRVIESGVAKRYERQVHMGVYRDNLQFQIYPFGTMCSDQVWAWAPIIRPERPVCRKTAPEAYDDDNDFPESEQDTDDSDD
jgi:hypothetical protein